MTDQPPPPACGLPHHTYPQTRCTVPTGPAGHPGRHTGTVSWDNPAWDEADTAARLLAAVETAQDDTLIPAARTEALASIQRILDEQPAAPTAEWDRIHAEAQLEDLRGQLHLIDGMRQANLEAAGAAIQRAEQAEAELAKLRALDERGYCPHCGRGDCAPTVGQWEHQRDRAERAEAEVERLRAERDHIADILADTYQVPIQTVLDDTLAALDQPTEAPAPPPPGSTRDQLPAEILALIHPDLPNYLSTACSTGQLLNCDLDQPHASQRNTWAERMHQRCRLNMKFTGQLCCCDCHDTTADTAND